MGRKTPYVSLRPKIDVADWAQIETLRTLGIASGLLEVGHCQSQIGNGQGRPHFGRLADRPRSRLAAVYSSGHLAAGMF